MHRQRGARLAYVLHRPACVLQATAATERHELQQSLAHAQAEARSAAHQVGEGTAVPCGTGMGTGRPAVLSLERKGRKVDAT